MNPGILWMLAASLAFTAMSASVKSAMPVASAWQAVFFRAAVGLPILVLLILQRGTPFVSTRIGWLILRALFGLSALVLFFYALSKIPLGTASMLGATGPIWILILGTQIPGERVSRKIYWLTPFFLLSVALIVKPEMTADWLPSLAALGSGLCGALAMLSLRKVGRHDATTTIVLYFSSIATLGSIPFALYDWRPLDLPTVGKLVAAGLFATCGQLLMTRAYKLERAGIVSLFGYSGPVFAYVFGLALFGELPSLRATLGSILIIVCGVIAFRISSKTA